MSDLTRRQVDILQRLRFRRSLGDCYLADLPRDRYLLIVPTMMHTIEALTSIQGSTLRRLHTAGLIRYGLDEPLPPDVARATRYLKLRTTPRGSTVHLTEAGLEEIQR